MIFRRSSDHLTAVGRQPEIAAEVEGGREAIDPTVVRHRVAELVAAQTGESVDSTLRKLEGREDLGLGSLDVVELVMAIEEEFGIEVPD